MKRIALTNVTRGTSLGDRIDVADGWWTRLRGLLGRPPLEAGQGLMLVPSRAIHMFGMRQSLDVAFLDRGGRVVALYPGLVPGKRTRWHAQAERAVELPPGSLAGSGTQLGDTVQEMLSEAAGSTGSLARTGAGE